MKAQYKFANRTCCEESKITKLFPRGFLPSRMLDFLHDRLNIPSSVSSVLLFGVPPYATGLLFWYFDADPTLLSYGFILGFFWLAIASYLIWKFECIAQRFFIELEPLVEDKEEYSFFVKKAEKIVHSNVAYLCGVPFIFGADYLVFAIFPTLNALVKILLLIYLSTLLFLAGIGFWGVISAIRMTHWIKSLGVKTNPYHPDQFGGFRFVGSVCSKFAFGFSSGSLMLPLAYEAILRTQTQFTSLLIFALTTTYIGFILLAFFAPIATLHSWFLEIKYDHLKPFSEKLQKITAEYLSSPSVTKRREFLDLYSFYEKINKTRVWLIDFSVLVKLTGSVLMPVIVSLVQFFVLGMR